MLLHALIKTIFASNQIIKTAKSQRGRRRGGKEEPLQEKSNGGSEERSTRGRGIPTLCPAFLPSVCSCSSFLSCSFPSSRCLCISSFGLTLSPRLCILLAEYDADGHFSPPDFSPLMQECRYGAHLSMRGLQGDRAAPVLYSLHVSADCDSEQSVSVRGRNEIRPRVAPRPPRSVAASEDGRTAGNRALRLEMRGPRRVSRGPTMVGARVASARRLGGAGGCAPPMADQWCSQSSGSLHRCRATTGGIKSIWVFNPN